MGARAFDAEPSRTREASVKEWRDSAGAAGIATHLTLVLSVVVVAVAFTGVRIIRAVIASLVVQHERHCQVVLRRRPRTTTLGSHILHVIRI